MGNSDQNRNVGPRATPRKPIKTQNLGCQTESQQTSGALLGSVSTATFSVILRDWLFLSLLLLFLPRMRTRRFRELRLGVESGDRPPGLGAVLPRLWPTTRGSRARILTQIRGGGRGRNPAFPTSPQGTWRPRCSVRTWKRKIPPAQRVKSRSQPPRLRTSRWDESGRTPSSPWGLSLSEDTTPGTLALLIHQKGRRAGVPF